MAHKSTSLFIGRTLGVENPVPYDPHTPMLNNKPPVCVITGQPGSGKTYLAQLITTLSTLIGKTTFVIDPKGDFMNMQPIAKEIGAPYRFINILTKKGALDPIYIGDDPGDKLSLTLQVIDTLIGGLSVDDETHLTPEVQDIIADSENKKMSISLINLSRKLIRSKNKGLINIGSKLEAISTLPYANLLFAPGGSPKSRINYFTGLTVIPLLGLDLPKEADFDNENKRNFNISENLSSAIMFMLTEVVFRLMMRKTAEPKTLIIDETWILASNKAGKNCIKQVGLLGRRMDIALILASQKNSHFKDLDVDVTANTRFCFSTSMKEAIALVEEMGLPQEENFESYLTDLQAGQCLMKDWKGDVSIVKIQTISDSWDYHFRNDPLKDAELRRAAAK